MPLQSDCRILKKVDPWKIHAPPDAGLSELEMPLHPKHSGEIIAMSPSSPCQNVPEESCFRQ